MTRGHCSGYAEHILRGKSRMTRHPSTLRAIGPSEYEHYGYVTTRGVGVTVYCQEICQGGGLGV